MIKIAQSENIRVGNRPCKKKNPLKDCTSGSVDLLQILATAYHSLAELVERRGYKKVKWEESFDAWFMRIACMNVSISPIRKPAPSLITALMADPSVYTHIHASFEYNDQRVSLMCCIVLPAHCNDSGDKIVHPNVWLVWWSQFSCYESHSWVVFF